MASLVPGFEYDIFISYRQKDNKYDGWVSDFVENLKKELEATFKEEVSVYFDINPHDGLLETHDVDASLKDKLKSLIFVPIISRTYCDPKSFAWEHEFKPFVEQASNDRFGLRVKLSGGNVASRVLPVRIHDLNITDVDLFESTIGGVLRGVDFIYKSAGVNRPLRANEDHPGDNLNKTYYRDQINKVANAIEEIISSLATDQPAIGKVSTKPRESEKENKKKEQGKELIRKAIFSRKSKMLLLIVISVFLFIAGAYTVFQIITGSKKVDVITNLERSIAVLPFINDSPDQENAYFINGLMAEVLNDLQKISDCRVISRRTVEQYRNQVKSIPMIAKELDVNYIVEGSGQKYGNTFRLRVTLIAASHEKQLWVGSFEQEVRETEDIFKIQSEIAQSIAKELKATITPEEKHLIDKPSTVNLTAYDFYQRGNDEFDKFYSSNRKDKQAIKKAEAMFFKALEHDSTLAGAYLGLGWASSERNIFSLSYYSENYLDSALTMADKALYFDDHLAEAYFLRSKYFYFHGKFDLAINELEKSLKLDPYRADLYYNNGYMLFILGLDNADYVKGLEYLYKGLSLATLSERPMILRGLIGDTYKWFAGFPEKGQFFYDEAFKLDNDSSYLKSPPKGEDVLELVKKSYAEDSTNADTVWRMVEIYSSLGQFEKSLLYVKRFLKLAEDQKKELRGVYWGPAAEETKNYYLDIGTVYLNNGLKEEAYKWLNKEKRDLEESIRLGRYLGITAHFHLADLEALMGNKAGAYRNLRMLRDIRVCPLWLDNALKNSESFRAMKDEPEFREIMKNMTAKYQAEHERVRKWMEQQGTL